MAGVDGIQTGVISGRVSKALDVRAAQVGMTEYHQGHIEKVPILDEIMKKSGLQLSEVAYAGDDLTDVPILRRVGPAFAPANARVEVKRSAHHITQGRRRCGCGARDGGDLPKARGFWDGLLRNTRWSEWLLGRSGSKSCVIRGRGLYATTGVIAGMRYITSVEIIKGAYQYGWYFEIEAPGDAEAMVEELRKLPMVRQAAQVATMEKIYWEAHHYRGRRGAGGASGVGSDSRSGPAQHCGEHISIDTIPLVGEDPLAAAVRAGRLPRVKAIVMAGSLMGGDIENAVREVRALGLLVVSLNMAGSVPEAADLVVTDPVQAGVMTVMAVADTAKVYC